MEMFRNDVEKLSVGVKESYEATKIVTNAAINIKKPIRSSLTLAAVSDIEKLAQKRGVNTAEERFKVVPDYAYPNTKLNREELRKEMNKRSSYFHNLRLPEEERGVGQLSVEIIQCFGIPKPELIGESSAFCVLVCGSHAFKTDVMPPVANPMWLSKMRRASIFPVHHAYARLYVGVFGQSANEKKDGFAGRVVVDLARLRPNCTYDVTLPLRQSAQVYSREKRGAIRFRFHLQWYSERQAMLSYLPKTVPKIAPNESVTVQCCDAKSFQNVARVVHGTHMPGRFTKKQLRATVKEINFTRIHVLRYIRKRELRSIRQWRYPVISAFVFLAWMHSIYEGSLRYIPGHLITFLLLYLWKNYAYYGLDSPVQNGFLAPTWEEMFLALVRGTTDCIQPLEMEMEDESDAKTVMDIMQSPSDQSMDEIPIKEIASAFRDGIKVQTLRYRWTAYHNAFKGTDAVDFLVDSGYASSREGAVTIGQRMVKEMKLFEHVARKHRFKDEPLFYSFLAYDSGEYVIKTHQPWGKPIFRMLGFLPPNELTKVEAQLEMPYSDGVDHPRFTVKESLVIRSKESQRILMQEQDMEDNGTAAYSTILQQFALAQGLDEFLEEESTNLVREEAEKEHAEPDSAGLKIKILKKPPQQDINFRKKSDKKTTLVLQEARHKVHGVLLHLFNDRVYKIDDTISTFERKAKISKRGQTSTRKLNKKVSNASVHGTNDAVNTVATKDEYNKLLGTDKYSHSTPWMSRIGVYMQPIVEIALEWLCFFRALFNVFTWRDPILSFWVSILGPIVVVILHLFPWRVVLGILGLVLFGPQNWLLRVIRERKEGDDEFDPDKIVKKTKAKMDIENAEREEAPLFSMYAPDNRPISQADIDNFDVRKVVVPYSQLMYQRFYDWPPENEYARVIAEDAPTGEAEFTEMMPSYSSGNESVESTPSTNKKGVWKSTRRLAGNMKRKIRRRKKISTTGSLEE